MLFALAQQGQSQLRDLLLQGAHLGLQVGEYVPQVAGSLSSGAGGEGSAGRLHRGSRRSGKGKRIGQGAAMQVGEVLELGHGQAFETGIARMQRPGQVGRLEPVTQGFGIDA